MQSEDKAKTITRRPGYFSRAAADDVLKKPYLKNLIFPRLENPLAWHEDPGVRVIPGLPNPDGFVPARNRGATTGIVLPLHRDWPLAAVPRQTLA